MKTNFDAFLGECLEDPAFAEGFRQAQADLDIALQIVELREARGMTQAALAKAVGTTQQVISRLESSSYRGHSRRMLEKVAHALGAHLEIKLVPEGDGHVRP